MNGSESVLNAVVKALEDVVESGQETRCRELMEDARRRADETVKKAHAENRARMRAAVEQGRESMEDALAATRARLSTRSRERLHRVDADRLQRARRRLDELLIQRWQDEDSRQLWISDLVESALSFLPGKRWRVEHPGGLDPGEFAGVIPRIASHCGGEPPEFATCEQIRAGLRIAVDGAFMDGTMEGLLADEDRIDAELLALLHAEEGDGATS